MEKALRCGESECCEQPTSPPTKGHSRCDEEERICGASLRGELAPREDPSKERCLVGILPYRAAYSAHARSLCARSHLASSRPAHSPLRGVNVCRIEARTAV